MLKEQPDKLLEGIARYEKDVRRYVPMVFIGINIEN
jgi:hypothetical protein